jgi:hypothetical protein
MVQEELTSRPPLESQMDARSSVVDEAEAMERIMRLNAPATAVSADLENTEAPKEIPLEQEVKLALGLLLKHRGGPGFGHGRLVGKELDLMAAKLRLVMREQRFLFA